MTPQKVKEFFARLHKQNPEPKGELEYINTYTLLVAVVLSAQATDTGVNKATRDLFKVVSTPEQMVALGEAGLKNYIKTIGLFNGKARNVIALSKILVDEHGSQVPRSRDELVKLPGVGRKTANVVLNIAFGEHTIAVDTHLFRVSNRTSLAPGKTPEQVFADFQAFTELVRGKLPDADLDYIAIAGNPARWAQVDRVRAANSKIEAFIEGKPHLKFINVFPQMLGSDGQPIPEIFGPDRLHMSPAGYKLWTNIILPLLPAPDR